MVPAILILTFAWTLKVMTESLGANKFVAGLVGGVSGPLLGLFPAIIFLVGAFLALQQEPHGAPWYTHTDSSKHLLRHKPYDDDHLNISVHGRCSMRRPLLTDIRYHHHASAGAQCNHMNHVSTQLPYAVLVAGISCLTYIIAGFVRNPVVPFIIGVLILIGTFVGIKYIIKYITRTDKANEQAE